MRSINTPGKKFSTALWNQYRSGKAPVIPDIKSRSPQGGDLLQGRDPVKLAKDLAAAGAPVLSVVTEQEYFKGSPELLQRIALATSLPVLRKDFINSRAQLRESFELGAGAALLIASMLEKKQLFELVEYALSLGLEPLVETHTAEELISIKELDLTMLGINNRNIIKLEMDDGDVRITKKLAGLARPGILLISESSISSPLDVKQAIAAGAHAALVGTAILQAEDPVETYRKLSETRTKSI